MQLGFNEKINKFYNIPSHIVIASHKLNNKPVIFPKDCFSLRYTSLKKFGTIIGKNVTIGVHYLINPGSVILSDSILQPFTNWKNS